MDCGPLSTTSPTKPGFRRRIEREPRQFDQWGRLPWAG
jgi:hypothetical protein